MYLNLQAKSTGHKCCSDNPLLKDVALSEEIQNWSGTKRCCFSATGERQLDKIENLTNEDKKDINQKLSELPNKRVRWSIYTQNIFLKYQKCYLFLTQMVLCPSEHFDLMQ